MNPLETAGYVAVSGEHLYTVLHGAKDPVARVLLVGPFASERHYSYIPWVRWARFLAARRIEALRYDYRGVGESTGTFENLSFDDWIKDIESLAGWLKQRTQGTPLVLHGLELGALLAQRAFARGVGDALLTWATPADANEILRTVLSRQVAMDQAFKNVADRKPTSEYVRELETACIEVDGYQWSGRLWRDSFQLVSLHDNCQQDNTPSACRRPVRSVKLDSSAAPLIRGSSLAYVLLNPDLSNLFTDNFDWITSVLSVRCGSEQ